MRRSVGAVTVVGLAAGIAVVVAPPPAAAAVSASSSGTVITVTATGPEQIGFSCNGSNQTVTGGVVSTPPVSCTALTRVNINGDGGAQVVLGSGLEPNATFPANPYLVVALGAGDDRVSETDRADSIDLGADDDALFLDPGGLANTSNQLGSGTSDTVYFDGTDGDDVMTASSSSSTVSVTLTSPEGGTTRSAVNAERLALRSGAGNDTLTTTAVSAASSVDFAFLQGGTGNDSLTSGPHAASLYGDVGTNTMTAGSVASSFVSDSPTDVINTGAVGADGLEDRLSGRSGGRTITGSTLTDYEQPQPKCDAQTRVRPGASSTIAVTSSLCRPGSQALPATIADVLVDFRDTIPNRALADVVLVGDEDYALYGDDELDDLFDITVPAGTFTQGTAGAAKTITTASAAYGDLEIYNASAEDIFVHGPWTNTYEEFGHRAIRDLLFRFATLGERIQIRNALAASTKTRAQIVSELMGTDEYRGLDVDRVFVRFLKRASDPAGRTYWISALRDGRPLRKFRAQLFGSSEYYTKAGGTASGFVEAAYFDVMGRLPDPSGRAYWTNKVANGADRGQVANTFLASTEARRTIVQDQFLRFLMRLPTTQESEQWVDALAGPTGEQQLIGFLAASQTYYQAD